MKTAVVAVALASIVGACSGGAATGPEPTATKPVVADQTPVAPAVETPQDEKGRLSFRVLASSHKGEHGLSPGSALKSGDKIAMAVSTNRDMYVYVMQFFPDQSAAVLYPAPGEDNKVSGSMRLPPGGWFQLDDVVGEENVYIVASNRPLAEADSRVLATVEEVRQSGKAPVAEATAEAVAETRDLEEGETDTDTSSTGDPTGETIAKADPKASKEPHKPRKKKLRKRGVGSGAGAAPKISMLTRGLTRVDEDGEGPLLHMETDEQGVAISVFSFKHLKAD